MSESALLLSLSLVLCRDLGEWVRSLSSNILCDLVHPKFKNGLWVQVVTRENRSLGFSGKEHYELQYSRLVY
jgi:hypothetical protein